MGGDTAFNGAACDKYQLWRIIHASVKLGNYLVLPGAYKVNTSQSIQRPGRVHFVRVQFTVPFVVYPADTVCFFPQVNAENKDPRIPA